MSKCECGCGCESGGRQFLAGHDQRLRTELENRVGGILALRKVVEAAESYAAGSTTTEHLAMCVREVFAKKSR